MQSTKTNRLFFDTWTAPYPESDTSVAELTVYTSSYVITRDVPASDDRACAGAEARALSLAAARTLSESPDEGYSPNNPARASMGS